MTVVNKKALVEMQNLLHERLGLDKEAITPEASLESLGIDSLMQIELLFDFEDKYKIKIAETTARPNTIGELLAIIEPFMPKE
jgi:acyl carrier protein